MWIIRIKNLFDLIVWGDPVGELVKRITKNHKKWESDIYLFKRVALTSRYLVCLHSLYWDQDCVGRVDVKLGTIPEDSHSHTMHRTVRNSGGSYGHYLHSTIYSTLYTPRSTPHSTPHSWMATVGLNSTDFACTNYALCPPDHSLCTAGNWQFIWEMWQIYFGTKHLLRLYICRLMMPENKGNWMDLYL